MNRLALIAGLALGCSQPDFESCTVRCGTGGSCPPDMRCLADNLCHVAGEEALCTSTPAEPPDAMPQACAGDTCSSPPSACYMSRGTCTNNTCVYAFDNGGSCNGTPPVATCVGSTLHKPNASGTCTNGACVYGFTDIACAAGCMDGACLATQTCILACSSVEPCDGIPDCANKCTAQCAAEETNVLFCAIAGGTCQQVTACLTGLACL